MPDRPHRVFLDTNIVLRSTVASAPEHAAIQSALDILNTIKAELWISRQVLREYAMTITRAQPFLTSISHTEAASVVRKLSALFHIADETKAVSEQWIRLLETIPMGGRQVHDANIAATMIAYQIPALLTLNTVDFVRFEPQIRLLSLADVEAMKPAETPDDHPSS